ncbi:MAG: MraY family glycosyltransferase [Armatimonadota bacterium]|jgi:UDP-GlcNAc:undecaprenyl-phosphate GlcNAc-1-phosphate transferase
MMRSVLQVEVSFVLAACAALLLTPLAMRFAHRVGALDQPGGRRGHEQATPRCGGLAIFAAFWIAVVVGAVVGRWTPDLQAWGVLVGGAAIMLMGLADDLWGLPVLARIVAQVAVAAVVATVFGIRIEILSNYFGASGKYIYLDHLSLPATVLWLVLITNGLNWIDGLDGLAAGITALAAVTLALMGLGTHGYAATATAGVALFTVAVFGSALAGTAVGFLRHNLPPARVFMGDSGSMFLGFVLGCIAVIGAFKKATLGILVPVLALGVPIWDFVSTIWLRWRNGQPIHVADSTNFHYRLLSRGLSKRGVLYLLYAATGALCVIALVLHHGVV